MAKYNVTFKCGHEEEVQLLGKYEDRERKIEWYKNSCDCTKCRAEKYRKTMAETHDEVTMSYREYKEKYADCKTLRDSYDSKTKTITVSVPKA